MKHWWLWARRGTLLDSRLAWVSRGVESGKKLDNGQVVNLAECEDALSWDKYCTGGTSVNIGWMKTRWENYSELGLLPDGDWVHLIIPYTPMIFDGQQQMLTSI